MARPLRIEFPGAIYHVTARGNARQRIFSDQRDFERLHRGLAQTVERNGWEFFAFAFMPNHVHLFFRTPEPNLSRGMQYLLSGYANWHSRRHQQPGHLFQGRFKAKLVEDESYFWTLSRYVHLNPVRGKRPLVQHPQEWPWSSYLGYVRKRHRLDWISYRTVLAAWQGEMGGVNAGHAYRRFIEAGLVGSVEDPFRSSHQGWLLGSEEFVERIRKRITRPHFEDEMPMAKRLGAHNPEDVLAAVAAHFGADVADFRLRRTGLIARDVAAWLARRLTTATMRELATMFGLANPTSVSNLTRRVDRKLETSTVLQSDIETIRKSLTKTKNEV